MTPQIQQGRIFHLGCFLTLRAGVRRACVLPSCTRVRRSGVREWEKVVGSGASSHRGMEQLYLGLRPDGCLFDQSESKGRNG